MFDHHSSVMECSSLTTAGYVMDHNYIPPMRMTQPTTTGAASAYSHAISSSPALYQSRTVPSSTRRHSELPGSSTDQSYQPSYRRISNPYDSGVPGDYAASSGQTIPSISGLTKSPMPSPALGSTSGSGGVPTYSSSLPRYAPCRMHQLRSQAVR